MEILFDIHAHYTDKRFDAEYPGGAAALLDEIMPEQAGYIINVSTNVDNAAEVIAQAKQRKGMYAAVGIHPEDIRPEAALEDEMKRLSKLLDGREENKIVAIGEIGFDYYWQPALKDLQRAYFEAQMELARKYGLPVQVHDREAHGDCLDVVRRFPQVKGVFHSFSGSPEMAAELVRLGWYISFSGVLTFRNARKTVETAALIPHDRMLIETDCPYLAPHPHRGELNHSGLLSLTAERLGEITGLGKDGAARLTKENALRLFNIKIV
jgi:TatD DNase family protein